MKTSNKEDLIKSSALKLFSQKGYLVTTVESIAKEAGISKGSVYSYFSTKEEILEAVLKTGFESIFSNFVEEINNEDEFEHFINDVIIKIIENRDFYRLYYALISQSEILKEVLKYFQPHIDSYLKLIEAYYNAKGYDNPMAKALLLGASIDGIGMAYILMGDEYPIEIVKKELIENNI